MMCSYRVTFQVRIAGRGRPYECMTPTATGRFNDWKGRTADVAVSRKNLTYLCKIFT